MKLVVRHGLRCFNKLGYTNDLKHETINFSDTVPFVSELLDKLRIKLFFIDFAVFIRMIGGLLRNGTVGCDKNSDTFRLPTV